MALSFLASYILTDQFSELGLTGFIPVAVIGAAIGVGLMFAPQPRKEDDDDF